MTKDTMETTMASHDDGQKPGDVISLVLTADNHLGYSAFGQQPRKREVLQQRLRQAFQQATDFALQQKVDLFIQAGDLFDTAVPQERDRSFVAERLSELKQAGIQMFALGGLHDIPVAGHVRHGVSDPSPLLSYERLGALHYFSPVADQKLEPMLLNLHGVQVGISGLSVFTEQDVDPLTGVQVRDGIDRASFSLLVLHAPIDGLTTGSSLFEARAQVSRQSLTELPAFRYVLAGYHHKYSRLTFGQTEVVVAGTTQHIDFNTPDEVPGFVYLGLAADGIRWCKHIPVESFSLQSLLIPTSELWSAEAELQQNVDPTALILERLRPLCGPDMLLLLRLEGELSRSQYHQLDLNQIRRYGEEQCFALAIDDSSLVLLSDLDMPSPEAGERFSPREELIALADEWIADAFDEHEQKAWRVTKEELLLALDDLKGRR
jgi:hypothetical protein